MTQWIERISHKESPFEMLMQEISQSAAGMIELDAYSELIMKKIDGAFHPHNVGLFLKQKAAGRFHLGARVGLSVNDIRLDLDHPLPFYLSRNPRILHADQIEILPQFRALWVEEQTRLLQLQAELFVPLQAGGELVGILSLGAKSNGRPYTSGEEQQITMICNQAGLVIRLKYLTTAELRWRQEAESMRQAISEITTDCDLEEALHRNLLHIREAFAFDMACISLLKGDRLVISAAQGYDHPEDILGRDEPAAVNELFQEVLSTRQTLLVEDTHIDDRFKRYSGPPVAHVWMGVPLITRGEVIGLLALTSRKQNAFQVNPARLELVQAYANQAAIIVEKARLFQVERQQRQLSHALQNIGSEMENLSDLNQVYDLLMDRLGKVVSADITMLFALQGGQLDLARTCLADHLNAEIYDLSSEPGFETTSLANLHFIVNSRRPQIIPDTMKDPDWIIGPIAVRSWAGVPILVDGKVIACFTFASLAPGYYQPYQTEVLEIFTEQVALAFQNFHLFKEIRELSTNDELTGVFTRPHFLELAEREFRRTRRFHRQLSLMMIDIDQFHKVNEEYGEDAGNQVLRSIANTIKANIRNVDVPARYQMEKFAVILTETDQAGATIISERLRAIIAGSPNITTAGLVKITVSIGVAVMSADIPNMNALIQNATQAMEEAKRMGRNRTVVFPNPPQKQ